MNILQTFLELEESSETTYELFSFTWISAQTNTQMQPGSRSTFIKKKKKRNTEDSKEKQKEKQMRNKLYLVK